MRTIGLSAFLFALAMPSFGDTLTTTIADETVVFEANTNTLRCKPGKEGTFVPETRILLDLDYPIFDRNTAGRDYIFSNVQTVENIDGPARCDKIAHLVGRPNPNFKIARAHRVVTQSHLLTPAGDKCLCSLDEEIHVTLDGEKNLDFDGHAHFTVGYVDLKFCKGQ